MSLEEDSRWLEWVTKQFESIAGDDKEIDLDEFKTALKVKEVSFLIMGTFIIIIYYLVLKRSQYGHFFSPVCCCSHFLRRGFSPCLTPMAAAPSVWMNFSRL